MPIRVEVKLAISEVATQQAELPQVIGDVLAHIAHSAIGADNNLLVFFRDLALLYALCVSLCCPCGFRLGCPRAPHHPAAFVLSFGLVKKHTTIFEFGEGRVPEVQPQDFALARQEVVFDVEPVHGLEMAV